MPANVNPINREKKKKKVIRLEKPKKEVKEPLLKYNPDDVIFALDIGTRTVVGILGIQEDDKFKIISTEVAEHKNRAMLDGQIHDISQVSEIAREVKEKLEKRTGMTLTKVAIAAAGRVLKTCEVKAEREIDQGREIDQEMINSLEIEGVQKAQLRLDEEISKDEKSQFYCVGYSVINYYLNGYIISKLIGHKGKKIGVDILATFLPHIVVDSLYTVMGKIGLEVVSLTLEPIAAINVTIPKDLRLLNLALVDIGAGTSDIAITRDGSVVAFAMAPIAGDEITEKIAQHYLVDFNTGEKIKTSLSSQKENITFVDILGIKNEIKVIDALEVIRPTVEFLAETISQKILEYNHKSPNAVFMIGGGSQLPGLTDIIAGHLNLAKERVVVRGRDIIQNLKVSGKKLAGPEAITPFGIAVTAQMQKGRDFLAVTLNGRKIRLFNSKKLNVADALILIGFNPGQLIGRTGKSVAFELNGVKKFIRGGYGKAAEIFVNDIPSSLETVLKVGDDIKVNPAEDGQNAEVFALDYINVRDSRKVTFNGSIMDIDTKIYVNGKITTIDYKIIDSDIIEINEIRTISDFRKIYEIESDDYYILLNSEETEDEYKLKDKDIIECKKVIREPEIIEESDQELEEPQNELEEEFEEQKIEIEDKKVEVNQNNLTKLNSPKASAEGIEIVVIINGKNTLLKGNKSQYIFVDIFNFINFDLSKHKGNIVLRLNGSQAAFTDTVKPGDIIDIYWER